MKDNNDKKSKAQEIIKMLRERQAQKEEGTSIRDIVNLKRKEREEEQQKEEIPQGVREAMLEYRINELEHLILNADPGPTEDELFHSFEELRPAMNALGLYRDIMEEIEFEDDPKVLKALIAERIGQILETVDDVDAYSISKKIKGI
jgi:hypothetical protein